jgi:cadmium resistance protein CadD (predicted permease)
LPQSWSERPGSVAHKHKRKSTVEFDSDTSEINDFINILYFYFLVFSSLFLSTSVAGIPPIKENKERQSNMLNLVVLLASGKTT